MRYRQPIRDEHSQRTKDWRKARYLVADRLPRIQPKTARAEKERARQLKKYFDPLRCAASPPLPCWHYIAERKKAGMSNGTIDRDLDVLRGVPKRLHLHHRVTPRLHKVGNRTHSTGDAQLGDEDEDRQEGERGEQV